MVLIKIFTALFWVIGASYYVWIMQLNGYFLNRCAKSVFFNKSILFAVVLSIVQIVLSLTFKDFAIINNFLCALLLTPFVFSGKKTPLKLTKRVIRWLLTIFALSIFAIFMLGGYCLPMLQLPIVLMANFILLPLEKLINCIYLLKAKKKLSDMGSIVIMITGSYGKTSVKNILYSFLSTKYSTAMSVENYNTPLGLAKFINSLDEKKEILILEAGARQKGDVAKICKLFKPTHAIITGVTSQHIETFGTLKKVIATKGEVLDFLENGYCIINSDDVNSRFYYDKYSNLVFAGKNGKDFSYGDLKISPSGSVFDIKLKEKKVKISTRLLGSICAQNVILAYALATKLGCSSAELLQQAEQLPYIPHRLELIKKDDFFILDDSYNANPMGMEGFLEVLGCFSSTKSVISQGIVEVGKETFAQNYAFAKKLAGVADYCAVLGQNSKVLYKGLLDGGFNEEKLFVCRDLNEAVQKLLPNTLSDGVIAFQNDLPDNMMARRRCK